MGDTASTNTCKGKIQDNLRWGVSKLNWAGDESMTQAICCDSTYAGLAEPRGLFDGLKLFDNLDPNGENTFYDPVSGKALFVAPKGRSFEQWKNETAEHGWP